MKNEKSEKRKPAGAAPEKEPAFVPAWMTYAGIAAVAAGLWLMQRGNTGVPGSSERMWYAGAVITALGAVGWLTAGMSFHQMVEWTRGGLIALALALVFRWAVAEPYRIPSGSMETTLHGDPGFGKGDRVWVNKWVYGIRVPFMNKRLYHGSPPQRWDIVVFKTVEKDAVFKTLVKRIVGLPGERIQIRNGTVYADGKPLTPPPGMPEDLFYTAPFEGRYGILPSDEYSRVPEGHYLLLGDNSSHSRDGRWFGWVPNENLVGRVACIWWPPPRWRDFTGFSGTLWWRVSAALVVLLTLVRLLAGRTVTAPTAEGGERWRFALALAYGFRVPLSRLWLLRWARPRRGELVLASVAADKNQEVSFTGWVAALPGERVTLEEGRLLVNGKERPLPAPVLEAPASEDAAAAPYGRLRTPEHAQVPEGHYFVLAPVKAGERGDSRTLGWVAERDILGRVGGPASGGAGE